MGVANVFQANGTLCSRAVAAVPFRIGRIETVPFHVRLTGQDEDLDRLVSVGFVSRRMSDQGQIVLCDSTGRNS